MADIYFTVVTDAGTRKMLEALNTEKKINVTEFSVGDGAGKYYTPTTEMTALKNEVWRGAVNACYASGQSENLLIAETVIPADIGGFTIREMGLFDDEGTLIAVCNTPDTQKARVSDGVVHELELSMEILISNTDSVQPVVDPNVVTATKKELEELQISIKQLIGDVKVTVDGNLQEQIEKLKITVDSELSSTSENPVQNKAVKAALDGKADSNHAHSNATTSAAGFMSPADKSKLDGIAAGANAYTHPNSGAAAGTYRSVTVNAQGHVTGGSNPTVTVAQGGTGATTVAAARNALGLGNTAGALPVANGGTGATTAANARSNLGITPANIGAVPAVMRNMYNFTDRNLNALNIDTEYDYNYVVANSATDGSCGTKPELSWMNVINFYSQHFVTQIGVTASNAASDRNIGVYVRERYGSDTSCSWANWKKILHSGNSNPVVIQSTAPSDTTALWAW